MRAQAPFQISFSLSLFVSFFFLSFLLLCFLIFFFFPRCISVFNEQRDRRPFFRPFCQILHMRAHGEISFLSSPFFFFFLYPFFIIRYVLLLLITRRGRLHPCEQYRRIVQIPIRYNTVYEIHSFHLLHNIDSFNCFWYCQKLGRNEIRIRRRRK